MTQSTLLPAIGLSGFAGCGKTTVANHIEAVWVMKRLHIAEPLRAMLRPLYEAFDVPEVDEYLTGKHKEAVVPGIGVTSRRMQITLGTEWGRQQVSPDLWVNAWKKAASKSDVTVINDSVRFPNEEAAIKELGGFTILIERDGCNPAAYRWGSLNPVARVLHDTFGCMAGVHDSERVDRLRPTYIVHNRGPIEYLLRQVDDIIAAELGRRIGANRYSYDFN